MDSHLQAVTELMLGRVEVLLQTGKPEAQAMKHLAGVLKDLRDIRKDAFPDAVEGGICVTMTPEVEELSG